MGEAQSSFPPHIDPSQRLRSNSKIALLAPSGRSPIALCHYNGDGYILPQCAPAVPDMRPTRSLRAPIRPRPYTIMECSGPLGAAARGAPADGSDRRIAHTDIVLSLKAQTASFTE
jgi:hypothetical protein